MNSWAVESYTKAVLKYRFASPKCAIGQRGTVLFSTDTVQWYIQPPTANFYFQTIQADKCVVLGVVHSIKGHSYSTAREVLWLYSIALAEELYVKSHSYTHIHLCTQGCSWQEPQQVAFRIWRTDWVNPGNWDCKLCSGNTTGWCCKDMLYNSGTSRQRELKEIESLRTTLSEIDGSYTWTQIKKLLQEQVFLWCEKFGTWSLSEVRVNQVLNRKVPQELVESSVLGPQKRKVSRLSPEQESTT